MTAKHEDILTNINYIKNGTVIDKLLESLVVTPINFEDLLIRDKNAIIIAARILGYGKNYPIRFYNESTNQQEEYTVELTSLNEKAVDMSLFKAGINEFSFTLPQSKNNVTFKLLNSKDEKKIDHEIKGLKKLYPDQSFDLTTRLKFIITSIEGSREVKDIREFVDKYLIAQDSRALRDYYNEVMPDIDLKITVDKDGYIQEDVTLPISVNFFWPDI